MKRYLLSAAMAVALSACGGNSETVMTDPAQNDPQSLLAQAQQAYENDDKATAIAAWQEAAAAGDATAQHNLSVVYRTGDGAARDIEKSLQYLGQSANQGYVPAVYDMGSYYLQQRNTAQAAPLLQAAAEQGYAPAQFNLGVMLANGDGVAQDQETGIALIKQAAEQGFPPAQQALQQSQVQ